jgi:hypothetical protein
MVVKNAMDCMHGFAIQGNFESARRNYTRVWSMLQQAQASGRVPPPYGSRPFHLHLVGRGLVSALALPKSLSNITSVHYNLAFPAYYEQVGRVGGDGNGVGGSEGGSAYWELQLRCGHEMPPCNHAQQILAPTCPGSYHHHLRGTSRVL